MSEHKAALPRERRRTTRGLLPLPQLITAATDQLRRLLAAEFALFKAEMTAKAKAAGIGGGLMASALVFVFFTLGALVTAAVFAFALILPGWLAALIVAAILTVLAIIATLIGWTWLRHGAHALSHSLGSELKADVQALGGDRR